MESKKNFYICFLFFLTNFSFIFCIIEIPLHPIVVRGDFKRDDLTTMISENSYDEDIVSFYDTGNAEINKELVFTANFKLNGHPEPFNLLLDTGSYAMWVAQKENIGKHNITHFYEPNKSHTCKETNETYLMMYGSGFVHGLYYYDQLEYIPNKISQMKFGVGSSIYFNVPRCDGIMGLGKEYENEEESLICSLKNSGLTDTRAFSIKFEGEFTGGVKGSMFIGIHDDFNKKETKSSPLVNKTQTSWKCNITSFGLKNSKTKLVSNESEVSVTFDTGTNVIYLPMAYFDGIKDNLEKFGCEFVNETERKRERYKCKKGGELPDIQFKINGYIYTIPKEDAHFEKKEDNDYLYSKAIFSESHLSYIMGSAFFFNFHTLFDMDGKELKFYPLKKGILEPDSPAPTPPKKLSTLAIVFIVIGCVAFVVAVSLIVYFVIIKRRKDIGKIDEPLDNPEERLYKEEEEG